MRIELRPSANCAAKQQQKLAKNHFCVLHVRAPEVCVCEIQHEKN